ncbi:MAG: phosphatase PAP2 family protein [Acidimicrobiales bacterium]|nr:phosphatase PAP2 family protein [Acidimicrobiales bacterium]
MNPPYLVVAALGLIIAGVSAAHARKPTISAAESRVFHAVNGLPAGLYPLLWLPMQFGNLLVGTVAGLGVAAVDRDVMAAVGVISAAALKLLAERVIRRRMVDYLTVRQRPGVSQDGAILRGADVPVSGPSFPSGHVILAAGVGTVVAPILGPAWSWVPASLTLLVMVGRVYVGAHNPLDVTAGLGTGLVLGGVLASLVD